MADDLLTPILRSGIRATHFFNGRVLTAEDLIQEQSAARAHDRQLGRAIGEGVVYGLQVTPGRKSGSAPTVIVSPGLAFNRKGQAVSLPDELGPVEVALAKGQSAQAAAQGFFAVCQPPKSSAAPAGKGVYLLVCSPVTGPGEEKVPRVGLNDDGIARRCDFRHLVDGVRFRLVELTPQQLAITGDGALNNMLFNELSDLLAEEDVEQVYRLRSLLAHLCLGTFAAPHLLHQAGKYLGFGGEEAQYGPLDALRVADCEQTPAGCLTGCEIPLALIYWTKQGIEFVDMGAARRGVHHPALTGLPGFPALDRRLAEGEAAYQQFHDQIAAILQDDRLPATGQIAAKTFFRCLPAAGFLPIGFAQFHFPTFFDGFTLDIQPLDPAYLRALIFQSWLAEPIPMSKNDQNLPALKILTHLKGDFVVFHRQMSFQPAPAPGGEVQIPTEEPSVSPGGTFEIYLRPKSGGVLQTVVQKLRQQRQAGAFQVGSDVEVYVVDRRGNRSDAQHAPANLGLDFRSVGSVTFEDAERFVVQNLPPDRYTVYARVTGFQPASKSESLGAGRTERVLFELAPARDDSGGRPHGPEGPGKGDWLKPDWWDKLVFIEEGVRWPWPPEEIGGFDPVVDPRPEEVEIWLDDWAGYVQQAFPGAPVDPGGIQIVVDKNYTPDKMPDAPYAYVVFGEGGAYAPVVLTPKDRSLERSVSLGKAGVAGVDRDLEAQVRQRAGVSDVDVLAAGWKGLIADAAGVSLEAAGAMMAEMRGKVDELQGSVQVFSGVDAGLAAALSAAGFGDAVQLANAAPQALAEAMQAQGVSLAFAQKLVSEARQVAPESAWKLEAAGLGLKESEIAGLKGAGIATLGDFKAHVATPEGLSALAVSAGANAGSLSAIAAHIDLGAISATFLGERKAAAPVTSLDGIDGAIGLALADNGISSVGGLANLESAAGIANLFGGDLARAEGVLNAARLRLGLG
jgi:hypothetical protein